MTKPRLFLTTAWLVVAAAACGVPKDKHQLVLDQLAKCQSDHEACVVDRDAKGKQVEELTTDRDATKKKLEGTTAELASAQSLIDGMKGNLNATKKELEELRKLHAQQQKRLDAFKALTARFQKMIDAGKIQVLFRNGQMVMKLPAGILFASGHAELSKDGEAVLKEVATILKEFSDRRFLIAGHTDTVPVTRGGRFKDNWELSTARAVTVTSFLIAEGVKAPSLGAAGYGEFDPVATNNTDEGKQLNRRIEIILVPNIEELPVMPETKS